MKVFVTQSDLLEALKIVSRAVSGHNTLPVLANILLRAEGETLTLAATNLNISITTEVKADIQAEGSLTVPAKVLTGYVSLLAKDQEVELSLSDDVGLVVKSTSSKTKVKGIPAEEFPSIPTVDGGVVLVLTNEAFRQAVHEVAFSAQENATRPILSGVFLHADGTNVRVAATDSYRLSEKKIVLESAVEPTQCIIPVRALLEADRLCGKIETISLHITPNQVLFELGSTKLVTRLIEGSFPDYTKIIPAAHNTQAIINRKELEMAVRRIAIFAKENNQHMKLDFDTDGKLRVMSDQTQVGEGEATLPVTLEGQANTIALNADYLLEALSALSHAEEITLELQEKMNPAVVKTGKDDGFVHLIMPLKM